MMYVFSHFIPKYIPNALSKHENQLHPISVLSNRGGTGLVFDQIQIAEHYWYQLKEINKGATEQILNSLSMKGFPKDSGSTVTIDKLIGQKKTVCSATV